VLGRLKTSSDMNEVGLRLVGESADELDAVSEPEEEEEEDEEEAREEVGGKAERDRGGGGGMPNGAPPMGMEECPLMGVGGGMFTGAETRAGTGSGDGGTCCGCCGGCGCCCCCCCC
jgi:hypothetical protein